MKILKYISNWRKDGDIDGDVQGFVFSTKERDDEQKDMIGEIEEAEKKSFFEKISWLKIDNNRKNEIAGDIVEDSYARKLYWIQFTLSCMIATLGLLMNSIPVIIGAMLISPILNPIKTFAFAITTGNRGMYLRSIKTIFFSILVAIASSVFISFIVPFSNLTTEVTSRISPTMVDLFVALFSGAVAFLSLGFKKLQENVAGVAMSVALLPPLSVIGIGIYFLNFGVAQGSFLLFMANLVAILIIGIVIFYMFGFFPTNKEGKKRSFVILLMVFLSILIISIPLQKSMYKIAENMKITNQINSVTQDYFENLDPNIDVNEISFKNVGEDLLRVNLELNIPDGFLFTDLNRKEFTKILSTQTDSSIELDINIVELSSVYVGEEKDKKDIFIENISNFLNSNYDSVFVVNYKLLEPQRDILYLSLYTEDYVDKDVIYQTILSELQLTYGDESKLIIQWQGNNELPKAEKTKKELELEKQFYSLFPNSTLNSLNFNSSTRELSGQNIDYISFEIDFITSKNSSRVKRILEDWKMVLEQYFDMEVIINSRVEYFSLWEL
ncbi:MAG TPA: TIGR00341 family protein [Candidatus Absconditabacterales bacterium]|nr:TIGR00341 family protein [Candidatus Absconditabacterales bacterium]